MIDFDRHADLDAQVRAALAFHGLEGRAESRFFDRDLVGQRVDEWRSQVISGEALELWDELAAPLAGVSASAGRQPAILAK